MCISLSTVHELVKSHPVFGAYNLAKFSQKGVLKQTKTYIVQLTGPKSHKALVYENDNL